MTRRLPQVLCLSGHDPGGGAGIQADIEAVAAQGAHALSIITALTVQDSQNVRRVVAVEPQLLTEQLDCLLADSPVQAIKLGLLGSAAQIAVIGAAIARCAVPVIADPVLAAGGGAELSDAALREALRRELLPQVQLLTPNAGEARRLAQTDDVLEAARRLQSLGCAQLLITGGDEPGSDVLNLWLDAQGKVHEFRWPRLAQRFHGAGCTLASAIAGRIACGDSWAVAIAEGQRYTQNALAQGFATGRGRLIAERWRPARNGAVS